MKSAQRGSMLIFGMGMLLFLTSFAVLAVDIGRIFIVRNELQNVADASALAGANCLTRQSDPGSTVNCLPAMFNGLNWDRARAKALDHLSHNTAAQVAISSTDGAGNEIEVGYWNINDQAWSGGSPSRTFTPLTVNDKPAVRVYVRKDDGVNNGPIAMLTRLMFGFGTDRPMWAQSVAVISAPKSVLPSSLIPVAINLCMFERFWDSTTGTPVIYTGSAADLDYVAQLEAQGMPHIPQTVNQPWTIRIGSSYHYGTCDSGQWTTFDQDTNSMNVVKELAATGNPNPLDVGDPTWIKPGTAAAGYNELNRIYPTPPGADVSVLVVQSDDLSHIDPQIGRELDIKAFAGFHIDDIKGGGNFYIEGHFIPSNITAGGSGIGPSYGTYQPPRIGG